MNNKICGRWGIGKHFLYLFAVVYMFFLSVVFSGAYFTDSESIVENSISSGGFDNSDIAINEFVPNPLGSDSAAMLNGEWVELYNKGNWTIDLNGWYLYDSIDTHELQISNLNVAGGVTTIPAKGFLTVYRNGDGDFTLNNSGGDQVRLYDGAILSGTLINSVSYVGSTEDKSWSRIPDGTGVFSDGHDKTPGATNN